MKIKHYAGYGTVTAKKISLVRNENNTILTVLVSGEHECGLIPNYIIPGEPTNYSDYTIKKWLIDRFDRSVKDINPFHYNMICEYISYKPETVKYTFTYCNDGTFDYWY